VIRRLRQRTAPGPDRAVALRLSDVVATSVAVAATTSRRAKIDLLAGLFRQAGDDELAVVVALAAGAPRQGRIGVGWATLSGLGDLPPGPGRVHTVRDLDRLLDELAVVTGPGSAGARASRLGTFLAGTDTAERELVTRLLLGGLRQGALEGVAVEALARAGEIDPSLVRRALMVCGDLGATAVLARRGGAAALAAARLEPGRALRPMLAATSPNVADAVGELGDVSVEWKLDGARIQVHRDGGDVALFTRNLNDVTARFADVVDAVLALPGRRFVLDGELIGLDETGLDQAGPEQTGPGRRAPRSFQDTISRFATDRAGAAGAGLTPFFFDCVHLDGDDLLDEPLTRRLEALDATAGALVVPRLVTADAAAAAVFAGDAVARGHEGVMVKALTSPYAAGRRGATWRKVKPVRTADLVVLAAEWGHGRRIGRLSNLHLGARDPDRADAFVMVGKTFKGLTDAVLEWQTEALLARQVSAAGITVTVRPELVVEIAFDGVQRSRRYPGGVALRFARVRRYRPDKAPSEADTIGSLQALVAGTAGQAG